MFVDRVKIFAQAGKGGRGCASFRREKFVPKGGPDGGDGGRGGEVILRADRHTDNLANLFYEPIIKAKSGGHGMGKKMHGRGAPSKIVNVPIGTIVYRTEAPVPRRDEDGSEGEHTESAASATDEELTGTAHTEAPPETIADLAHDGEQFVLCAGGRGGKGNVH